MANENLKKFLDRQGVSTLWGKVVEKIDAQVAAEAKLRSDADAAIIKDVEDNYVGKVDYAADKLVLEGKITAAETAAKQHATDLDTAMDARVDAIEAKLAGDGEGTVAEEIAGVKTELEGKITELTGVVSADKAELEGKITDLTGVVSADKAELEGKITKEAEDRAAADEDLQDAIDTLTSTHNTDKAALEAADAQLVADLAAEVARAKAAEEANANAIALLTDGVDQDKVDGVKDLIDYVEKHGPEVVGMKEDIAENAQAIADEAARAKAAEEAIAKFDEEGKLVSGALKVEETRALAAEDVLTKALAKEVEDRAAAVIAEETRATGVESGLATRIKALEDANAEGGANAEAFAALEAAIAKEAEDRAKADSDEVTARNTAIADAIAQEVTDRNVAIGIAKGEANSYTDGKIATEVSDRNTAISNAIATEVTNRNDAISSAIATEVSNRNTAIATAKQGAIDTAAADATSKANTAESNAKAYADTEIAKIQALTADEILAAIAEVEAAE